MVASLLALALLASQAQDTSQFADDQTARLIEQARVRHRIQDTLVHDYQANVRTRVDAGLGRSRFARIRPLAAIETAARITWARPNDLKVQVLGARSASSIQASPNWVWRFDWRREPSHSKASFTTSQELILPW